MKSQHLLAIGWLLAVLPPRAAFAQESDPSPTPRAVSAGDEESQLNLLFEKEEVVVTATKSRVTVQKAPSIVSVVSSAQLRRAGVRTLLDALKLIPGLEVSWDTLGQPRLAVRGKRSDAQILVLLDGVRLNGIYDGRAILDLPVGIVDRLEVIRGPGSALYGTDAFAGVINVITRQERGASAAVFGGSYATGGAEGVVGIGGPSQFATGYVEVDRTDGPAFPIAEDNLSGTGQGIAGTKDGVTSAAGKNATVALMLARRDTFQSSDRLSIFARYLHRDAGQFFGPFDTLAPAGKLSQDLAIAGAGWDVTWTQRLETQMRVYGIVRAVSHDLQLTPDGFTTADKDGNGTPEVFPDGQRRREQYQGQTFGTEAQLRWRTSPRESVTAGAQIEEISLPQYSLVTNSLAGAYRGPTLANYENVRYAQKGRSRLVAGFYVQDERELAARVGLTLGIRHDQYSDFGGTTNPRAALVWAASDLWTFKLLYGTAFRAPTFQELYDRTEESLQGAFVGNPALKPETIRTAEAGAEARFKVAGRPLNLRANVYYEEIRGRIDQVALFGTSNQLRNFGNVNTVGGEVEGRFVVARRSYLFANASWFRAVDLQSKTYLTDVPQWRYNTGFAVSPIEALNLFVAWEASGERRNDARSTLERIHAWKIQEYGLLNATVSTEPLFQHWLASASVYDALDYRAHDDVPRPDRVPENLPVAERTFWLRISFVK